jgi:hypothetical protein
MPTSPIIFNPESSKRLGDITGFLKRYSRLMDRLPLRLWSKCQHNWTSTLTGLTSGKHTITKFANDTAENTESTQTINFTIPEPFPTTTAIVAAAIVVVIAIGLFVHFKKHHKSLSPTAGLANIPA